MWTLDAGTSFASAPVGILMVALAHEVARIVAGWRRPLAGHRGWMLLAWFVRPWACWAGFNLGYRAAATHGFNNPRTFPFFANGWDPQVSWADWLVRLAGQSHTWFWLLLSLILLLALLGLGWVLMRGRPRGPARVAGLLGLYVLAVGLQLSVTCLPEGAGRPGERRGSLLSCWKAHTTMLYAVPIINKRPARFVSDFLAVQPRLRVTIHALSHPPGAALSMHWLGCVAGARGMNIRDDSTRLRYAVALPLFSALTLFILYGLGRALFGSARAGVAAVLLWACSPAVLAYHPFAQDGVYALCFAAGLLLIWRSVMAPTSPLWRLILLGIVFFGATMLNYSWCILTTIFALFLLWRGRSAGWGWREFARRGVWPLVVMATLLAALCLHFRFNYLAAYRYASAYVNEWYRFEGWYQHAVALVGGQMEIVLMAGAVTAVAAVAGLFRPVAHPMLSPSRVFVAIILGVYAMPILFGPNCLKMEVARCWLWVPLVPLCFAARELLRRGRGPALVVGAAASSALTYIAMRLFITFSP